MLLVQGTALLSPLYLRTFFNTLVTGVPTPALVESLMGTLLIIAALAVAQTGGLVGRVFWGVVGDRIGHTRLVLGSLGIAMAAAAAATVGTSWTFPLFATFCFLFGLTASG